MTRRERRDPCIDCYPNVTIFGEVVPGFVLLRHDGQNRDRIPVGTYALHDSGCDNPCYAFAWRPTRSPWSDYSREEVDSWVENDPRIAAEGAHIDRVDEVAESFKGPPEQGYHLISACLEAGWNWDNSGMVAFWLVDRMARMIDEFEVPEGNQ